eukprot:TRINITY_DN66659_c8_g5_i1.p1 TRINITY_DN66659_c8_g5~~TRINITY_DN66659_c8_g5_i1.p1  ORF type:complete len:203 (-),score=39.58 TRINITY_DN66659_c8_g5_i1:269-877(-)
MSNPQPQGGRRAASPPPAKGGRPGGPQGHWECMDDHSRWQPVSPDINSMLESAVTSGKPGCSYSVGGRQYAADLTNFTQTSQASGKVRVLRRIQQGQLPHGAPGGPHKGGRPQQQPAGGYQHQQQYKFQGGRGGPVPMDGRPAGPQKAAPQQARGPPPQQMPPQQNRPPPQQPPQPRGPPPQQMPTPQMAPPQMAPIKMGGG